MNVQQKLEYLAAYEEKIGFRMFMGKPDRWYEKAHWRCENNHVSLRYLKSSEQGDLCFACYKPVFLTFPEDVDGEPL
jgi:hypothetical protein